MAVVASSVCDRTPVLAKVRLMCASTDFERRRPMDLDTRNPPRLSCYVDPIRFSARIRYWDPAKSSGLAVVDIPVEHIPTLGGLKQQRARGSLAGADFASSVMPAGKGRLALSVSKAMMAASHLAVGDDADVEISGVGRD